MFYLSLQDTRKALVITGSVTVQLHISFWDVDRSFVDVTRPRFDSILALVNDSGRLYLIL